MEIRWKLYIFIEFLSKFGRNFDGHSMGVHGNFAGISLESARCMQVRSRSRFFPTADCFTAPLLTFRSSWFPPLCIFHQDQTASKTFTRPWVTCGPWQFGSSFFFFFCVEVLPSSSGSSKAGGGRHQRAVKRKAESLDTPPPAMSATTKFTFDSKHAFFQVRLWA